MAENKNVLREMFVKVGLIGDDKAKKSLKGFKKALKGIVGDFKAFRAHVSALAVSKAFGSLTRLIGATTSALKGLIKESSTLASVQEDAERGLETALRLAGDFSESSFAGFKKFASELQEVSRIGDEVTLGQLTLAKNMGATDDQAKDLVTSAVNLAEALKIDVSAATKLVGRTLQGEATLFKRYGLDLSHISEEGLRAGEAFKFINKQFGGIAKKNLNSFSGALDQLSNSFGDRLEEAGAPLNEVMLPALKQLRLDLDKMTPTFKKFGQTMATAFGVFERMFNALGGTDAFGKIIDRVGRFLLDMALLFEDFFYFLAGEDSFLGKRLGGKGIGAAISDGLGKAMAAVTPTILGVIGDTIISFGSTIGSMIKKSLFGAIEAVALTIKYQYPWLAKALSYLGDSKYGTSSATKGGSSSSSTSNVNTFNNSVSQNVKVYTPQAAGALSRDLSLSNSAFKSTLGVA